MPAKESLPHDLQPLTRRNASSVTNAFPWSDKLSTPSYKLTARDTFGG